MKQNVKHYVETIGILGCYLETLKNVGRVAFDDVTINATSGQYINVKLGENVTQITKNKSNGYKCNYAWIEKQLTALLCNHFNLFQYNPDTMDFDIWAKKCKTYGFLDGTKAQKLLKKYEPFDYPTDFSTDFC